MSEPDLRTPNEPQLGCTEDHRERVQVGTHWFPADWDADDIEAAFDALEHDYHGEGIDEL